MQITLTSKEELAAAGHAIGTAMDNEHDKGPEGAGEDILAQFGVFAAALEAAEPGQALPIDLHSLALLAQYLDALDGSGSFEDEDDPEAVEAARVALLKRINDFVENTTLEATHD